VKLDWKGKRKKDVLIMEKRLTVALVAHDAM
jgi:hypothetical protein